MKYVIQYVCFHLPFYWITNFMPCPNDSICKPQFHCSLMVSFLFDREQNIVGKGENVVYQDILFPPCFQNVFSAEALKNHHCMVKGQHDVDI